MKKLWCWTRRGIWLHLATQLSLWQQGYSFWSILIAHSPRTMSSPKLEWYWTRCKVCQLHWKSCKRAMSMKASMVFGLWVWNYLGQKRHIVYCTSGKQLGARPCNGSCTKSLYSPTRNILSLRSTIWANDNWFFIHALPAGRFFIMMKTLSVSMRFFDFRWWKIE